MNTAGDRLEVCQECHAMVMAVMRKMADARVVHHEECDCQICTGLDTAILCCLASASSLVGCKPREED